MQLNQVAGLVAVDEGDHIGLYIAHNPDAAAKGEPTSVTKFAAWHPGNRSLVVGNASEYPVLKQLNTGKLPDEAVENDKVDLVLHFDAEMQSKAYKAARLKAQAESGSQSQQEVAAQDEVNEVEEQHEEVILSPEEQAAADEAALRESIASATKKAQLLDIAAEHNVTIADPEAKMDDLRAEILAQLYPDMGGEQSA